MRVGFILPKSIVTLLFPKSSIVFNYKIPYIHYTSHKCNGTPNLT